MPADTANTNLYTVPSATQAVISTLHVANTSASTCTFDVYVRIAGVTAGNANAIAKDVSIGANSMITITTGITVAATDVITVQSSAANDLTFTAFGTEITS